VNEQEAIARMVAPGTRRPGKYREGVIQIHVTRACDKSCFSCTQASNVGGRLTMMSPDHFRQAVESLRGYFGVVGVFGGNPAMSPHFEEYCKILRESWVPFEQRGLWCNNLINESKAKAARETFDPKVSNLNVHLDIEAWDLFRRHWPEAGPVGLRQDSRHSPPWIAMRDVLKKNCPKCEGKGISKHTSNGSTLTIEGPCLVCNGTGKVYDEEEAWELISDCDINQHWSAMIGVFRGGLRAWFCEVAGAQAMLHQWEEDCPDTGLDPTWAYDNIGEPMGFDLDDGGGRSVPSLAWWQLPMLAFNEQVRHHCHSCGVPLRGWGQLAQDRNPETAEQVSQTHADVYKPKDRRRPLQLVTERSQVKEQSLEMVTRYLQNSSKQAKESTGRG
jgi:hypothetical protein